ncbi:uncharacterized protein G2W53_007505 [Senna tora]|uniref:Uncharacterized protein n=1 Tax=Senna tora TaxID=362788 RepID=A0A834X7Q9_9FABA|nr:uncharacterized protein G2W53_007505 [Senna tora]
MHSPVVCVLDTSKVHKAQDLVHGPEKAAAGPTTDVGYKREKKRPQWWKDYAM